MGKTMNSFMNWLFEPLKDLTPEKSYGKSNFKLYAPLCSIVDEIPIKSIIKNEVFRPSTFSEYIGQRKNKEIIKTYINGIKERNKIFPHMIITGASGSGKTTLAKIMANELKVNFEECVASDLINVDIILERLKLVKGGILFLDEIHSIPIEIAEKMYSLMEDFSYNGKSIQPFTLIGATTEYGEMLQKKKPFCKRFKLVIDLDLEKYTLEDLTQISKQYKERAFPSDKVNEDFYATVAINCRNNPRALINLLEAGVYFNGNLKKVLESFGIIKNGFTARDLIVLKYIALNKNGVGLQTLANYLVTPQLNYVYNIEPYLLENELILKTGKGRTITNKGIEFIKILEKENESCFNK
jgi:Holliday junction DNA helicase RuvB